MPTDSPVPPNTPAAVPAGLTPRIAVLAALEAHADAQRWLRVARAQREAAARTSGEARDTATFRADAAGRAAKRAYRASVELRLICRALRAAAC